MRRIAGSSTGHTSHWTVVRVWVAATALMLALGAPAAAAQPAVEQGERQIESRIANVNGEMIQLDDGTVVRVPHGLALQADLREGRRVKIRYELKEGTPVAKAIEFLQEPSGSKP